MKLLSRPEELVMLAVWQLEDNAYLITIRRFLSEATGRDWSVGAVFVPLNRLVKSGLARTRMGEATAERGGRSKKYYSLTKAGLEALGDLRKVNEFMWEGFQMGMNTRKA